MKTEMLWSASGAMTDFAILVTPMGCELEALPPPDTTFRANHVASATLMYSDWGSSKQTRHTCGKSFGLGKKNQKNRKLKHLFSVGPANVDTQTNLDQACEPDLKA